MPLSTTKANSLLTYLFDTDETSVYVALYNGSPGKDGSGGTEVSGGSYARQSSGSWTTAADGSRENSAAITFPTSSAAWGDVTHFALFDAAAAGNLIGFGAFATSFTVGTAQAWTIQAGELAVVLD